MSRRDYSCKDPYPTTRLPVGYDFSNIATINHPRNDDVPEMVVFHNGTIRQQKSKIQTGSFLSQRDLKKILHKDSRGRAYYKMIEAVQKNSKHKRALLEDLPVFYLNIINNINRLKKNPDISSNRNYLEIISLTQKYITDFAKDHKEDLFTLIKHHDKDFISRMCIWTIAKYLANENYFCKFYRADEIPGWKTLFLMDRIDDVDTHQIPIRSFKYIFWYEFEFRNQLKELQMLPEESS